MTKHKYTLDLHDTHISDHRYIYTTINTNKKNSLIRKQTFKIIDYNNINRFTINSIIHVNDTEMFITKVKQAIESNTHVITKNIIITKEIKKTMDEQNNNKCFKNKRPIL